jgi:hypothetical protein
MSYGHRGMAASSTEKPLVAVLDTNAFLDVYSCHDVMRDYALLYEQVGNAAAEARKIIYRRARSRESLLLAIHLHNIGARTVTLQSELLDQLEMAAPSNPPAGEPYPVLGIPLITNEGFGETGYKRGDVIKRAERARLRALHPYQFYREHSTKTPRLHGSSLASVTRPRRISTLTAARSVTIAPLRGSASSLESIGTCSLVKPRDVRRPFR